MVYGQHTCKLPQTMFCDHLSDKKIVCLKSLPVKLVELTYLPQEGPLILYWTYLMFSPYFNFFC